MRCIFTKQQLNLGLVSFDFDEMNSNFRPRLVRVLQKELEF